MANSFVSFEKYLPGIIDAVYYKESIYTKRFRNPDVKLNWLDVKTVKIISLSTSGATNYNRFGHGQDNSYGSVRSEAEIFTISQERYSALPIDKLDSLDDAETVLGHLQVQFSRTQVVPEEDAYITGKLVSFTNEVLGNRITETLTKNNIIERLWAAKTYMTNAKVPEGSQVILLSAEQYANLTNAADFTKYITVGDFGGDVNYKVLKFQGIDLIVAPSDRFFSSVVLGEGYAPATDAVKVNFIMVADTAINVVRKLDWAKVYSSDQVKLPGNHVGYSAETLRYFDVFCPKNKRLGVYVSLSQESAVGNAAGAVVAAVAGAAGKTKITEIYTIPGGLAYDKAYLVTASASVPALGAAIAAGANILEITLGADIEPGAANNVVVLALNGKAVAKSKDYTTTLPEGD